MGGGAFQYLPARAFGAMGDKKSTDFARQNLSYKVDCVIVCSVLWVDCAASHAIAWIITVTE